MAAEDESEFPLHRALGFVTNSRGPRQGVAKLKFGNANKSGNGGVAHGCLDEMM